MSTRRWWPRVILGTVGLALGFAFVFGPTLLGRGMNPLLPASGPEVGPEAARLHATLAVADLHADPLLWNRDLVRRGSWGHVDIPRLAEGRVAVQMFTVVTKTPRGMNIEANAGTSDNITPLSVLQRWPPRTWGSLVERALYQADKLHRMAAASGGRLAVIRDGDALRGFLAGRDPAEGTVAGLLGLEGAHALEGDPDNLVRLYDAGFRMIGLTHFFDNEVGGSAHGVTGGGLTPFGAGVVRRMEELGMIVDLAHASPALLNDVLGQVRAPVVVSHTGVRGTCDNQRNLDDEQLRRIAATGGVVGIGLWETALCGTTPAAWARAVRHAVNVAGVDHVGLGSDWDGAVATVVDAAGAGRLTQALLDEGFSAQEIEAIMGANVVRVLQSVLPRGAGREPFARTPRTR